MQRDTGLSRVKLFKTQVAFVYQGLARWSQPCLASPVLLFNHRTSLSFVIRVCSEQGKGLVGSAECGTSVN